MSQNSNVVLFVTNVHQYDGNHSNPPMLSNTAEKSVFYFTDTEGNQYVYIHDYPTKTDWIVSGKNGWEERHYIDYDNISCDLDLDTPTTYWLACCFAVSNHRQMIDATSFQLIQEESPTIKQRKNKSKVDDIG